MGVNEDNVSAAGATSASGATRFAVSSISSVLFAVVLGFMLHG